MFVCTECSKNLKNKERVFSGTNWCRACVHAESQRSIREDSVQGLLFGSEAALPGTCFNRSSTRFLDTRKKCNLTTTEGKCVRNANAVVSKLVLMH